MKTIFLGALALAAVTAAPAAAFAQMYMYVSGAGEVKIIDAMNSEAAIAAAVDRAPTSGVMIVNDTSDSTMVGMDVPIDPTPPVTPTASAATQTMSAPEPASAPTAPLY